MREVPRACPVVHPERTREDFEAVAAQLGLVQHRVTPGDERRAYEQVWATPDQATAVHYLEDPLVGLPYLSLRGGDLQHYITAFVRHLEVLDGEDALEMAEGALQPGTQVEAIAHLAVTFPEYDPRAFSLFWGYATRAPDPVVREAAVNNMAYHAWPEFIPLLERIVAEDPEENVRRRAREILPHLRAAAALMGAADAQRFGRYLVGELFWELEQHPKVGEALRHAGAESVEVLSFTGYTELRVRCGSQEYQVRLSWRKDTPPRIVSIDQ
jgi:hypothetical protein